MPGPYHNILHHTAPHGADVRPRVALVPRNHLVAANCSSQVAAGLPAGEPELEEYARKFEGTGRQSSRRSGSSSTTPTLDQLRRDGGWQGEPPRDGRESVLTTASQRSDSSGETLGGSSSGSSPRGDYVRMRAAPRTRPANKLAFSPGLAPTTELTEEPRRRSAFFPPPTSREAEEEGDYCPPTPREQDSSPALSKSVPNLVAEEDGGEDVSQPPSYIYLDPDKKMKVTDGTLKLIQKQAVLDYYERQRRADPREGSKPGSPEGSTPRKFHRSVSQGSLALPGPSPDTSPRLAFPEGSPRLAFPGPSTEGSPRLAFPAPSPEHSQSRRSPSQAALATPREAPGTPGAEVSLPGMERTLGGISDQGQAAR